MNNTFVTCDVIKKSWGGNSSIISHILCEYECSISSVDISADDLQLHADSFHDSSLDN